MLVYVVIMSICIVVTTMSIYTLRKTNNELKKLEKERIRLLSEIKYLKRQLNENSKKETETIKDSISTSTKKDNTKDSSKVINNNYFIGDTKTYINTGTQNNSITNNTVVDNSIKINKNKVVNKTTTVFNNKVDKSDFISWLKNECHIVDDYYIISKIRIASMMNEYNQCQENIFYDDFITIYGRHYITQKGINRISGYKEIKSVFNDLVNQNLIITFYEPSMIEQQLTA